MPLQQPLCNHRDSVLAAISLSLAAEASVVHLGDSMSYPFGNDPTKIDRYRRFWAREPVQRPLVGFSLKSWFPMLEFAAARAWRGHGWLTVDMVQPQEFVPDQERLLREGEVMDDDIIRGTCPAQEALQWFHPILGAPLRILEESTLAPDLNLPWDKIEGLALDRNNPWFRKYLEFVRVLVEASQGRYPVSHATLVGPSDIAASLRGHSNMILDFYDAPEKLYCLLWRVQEIFREVQEAVWSIAQPWQGGYFDAQYSLWCPAPTVRMQEDASGLFSPKLYRELLQPVDREWARHYPCAFIHLHSTSMFLLDDMLAIEEIAAFQVNRDVSGPPLDYMLPFYRRIQQAGRPLLIRASFTPDELSQTLAALDPAGLYLYIMVRDMAEVEPLRKVLGM
ncbi:MAG: hypothetical protein ACUVWR_02460 [Anaerolineae bacterium]